MKYRIEEVYGEQDNINKFCLGLFKQLKLEPDSILSHITRRPYDDSDFKAWVFKYENKESLKKDYKIIGDLEFMNKPLFSISGDGWGTGLSISLNLSSQYD